MSSRFAGIEALCSVADSEAAFSQLWTSSIADSMWLCHDRWRRFGVYRHFLFVSILESSCSP